MVKQLNFHGKILHSITSFFPIYVFWSFFWYKNIDSWSIKNLIQLETVLFILLSVLSIGSIFLFYGVILRKRKSPDKEINIESTEKASSYLQYSLGAISPFLLFLSELLKDASFSKSTAIIGTMLFIITGLMLVWKDERGILYNIFYIPYQILIAKTREGRELTIISKRLYVNGYIRLVQ